MITLQDLINNFPRVNAGDILDGLEVLEDIPNLSSIRSSFTNYKILKGIRKVPINMFPYTRYVTADDNARVDDLVKQITHNKKISPLIIANDSKGWYILEGGHRFDALYKLNKKYFPALLVLDFD